MKKRSLTIHGHRTSISLEEPFWAALNDIAKARQMSVASLVQMIDKERIGGLSSAIRIFILAELRHKLGERRATKEEEEDGGGQEKQTTRNSVEQTAQGVALGEEEEGDVCKCCFVFCLFWFFSENRWCV